MDHSLPYRRRGDGSTNQKSDRAKKNLADVLVGQLFNNIEENPFTSTTDLLHQYRLACSPTTIRRRLKENNFNCRIPAKKIVVTEGHRSQRLEFAVANLNRNWQNVFFWTKRCLCRLFKRRRSFGGDMEPHMMTIKLSILRTAEGYAGVILGICRHLAQVSLCR